MDTTHTQHIYVNVLGMKRINARLVPKHQNLLPKPRGVEVTKEMLDNVTEDPTFNTSLLVTRCGLMNMKQDL